MNSFQSASKSSQYASAASPGVNLERGAYRMRAPSIRPLPSLHLQERTRPAPNTRPAQQRANGNVTFLLLLLVAACMTSFGMAYYLYTTRWDIRASQGAHVSSNATREATGHEQGMTLDPTQRYLTYLPHSGFHNQRIALENAFVLAYALNRTLLIPPIRLGDKPIRYVEYDTLSQYHELSGSEGLEHCLQIPPYVSQPLECSHYPESSYLPWTWLLNLSSLYPLVPHRHSLSMSPAWRNTYLDLTPEDVYTLKDRAPYQYRFVDFIDSASSRRSDGYQEDLHISRLLSIEQKLIQLGTLFGTTRLALANPDNLSVQSTVRRKMAFTNQDLLGVANTIAQSLGSSFSAIHLRLGDGSFQTRNGMTVNKIWLKLLHDIGLSLSQICELAFQCGADMPDTCDQDDSKIERGQALLLMKQAPILSHANLPHANVTCRGLKYLGSEFERLNRPLFVATDIQSPESHPLISVFRRTFPCIFFLGDFHAELKSLETIRSPHDGVYLKPFILPFVDALVASKALHVVGTDKSTFSKFVKEVLWAPLEVGASKRGT